MILHVEPSGGADTLRKAVSGAYAALRAMRGLAPVKGEASLEAGVRGPVAAEQGGRWYTLFIGGRPAPAA